MSKVYVLFEEREFESPVIVGIYKNKDKAQTEADKCNDKAQYHYEPYQYVREHNLID